MADLRALAHDSMEGRRAGTPGSERARTYLLRRFQEVGLEPFAGGFEQRFAVRTQTGTGLEATNLIGRVPGSDPAGRVIVVSAHYDHLGVRDGQIFNGADDNASGTAALLALAEYFRANQPRSTIVLAAFDAEESGLQGARHFVGSPPVSAERIAANVNMDMVSRSEAGEVWVAGTHHYPKMLPLVEAVAARSDVTVKVGHDRPDLPQGDDWTSASDHGPFHAAGIPFLYFGVEDHSGYHNPSDDAEHIKPEFYAAVVATIIDAVRELDARVARGEMLK
jgi:Zn-dependent M28 family amino/carboxypeptidase